MENKIQDTAFLKKTVNSNKIPNFLFITFLFSAYRFFTVCLLPYIISNRFAKTNVT